MRAHRLLFAAVFLIAAAALPAGSQTAATLRVALIPGDIAAEVYYARDMGFFKKAGIDDVEVTPITAGPAISAAVASGAVDVGYSNVVSLAIAHDRGVPVSIIAPANMHTTAVVTAGILTVAKTAPIREAKDLNGKIVAVNALNNISDVAVRAWVDRNGGDAKTVKFAELPFPQMPDAVRAGRVDAASIDASNEQSLTRSDSDLRRLANVFDAVSPDFMVSAWFATPAWVDGHPALARTFLNVIRQTAAWANANHPASATILAKYVNKSPQDIQLVTRVPYAQRVRPEWIQPSIDAAFKYGLVKTAFPARDLINPIAQ
jgi:NitT/TauT family transport system substrate-binding protein